MQVTSNDTYPTLAFFALGSTALLGGVSMSLIKRYMVGGATQYILKTGIFIDTIQLSKKTFVLPFQRGVMFDISPKTYQFTVCAMTMEKMEFQLPGVFTIAPYKDLENMKLYAERLITLPPGKVDQVISGIIEGETRLLAANMTIEDIFNNRATFKDQIRKTVQHELDKSGLEIFNANIKEMQDHEGSEYFTFMRQKTKEGAMNRSRVEVAEARKSGELGEKTAIATMTQGVALIEAETTEIVNINKFRKAQSEATLAKQQADLALEVELTQINAVKSARIREEEMQRRVEEAKVHTETESRRALELSRAIVDAEVQIKSAEGSATSQRLTSDARLYSMQREADGELAKMEAQATGLGTIIDRCAGVDFSNAVQYLMIEKGVYPEMAKHNAEAIRGLSPRISVWNTGSQNQDPISGVMQSIPPLFDMIHQQIKKSD